MIEDLIAIQYIALAFGGAVALLWIVLESSRKPPARARKKARIFACGTEAAPEELNVPPGGYLDYMKGFFRTGFLARMHSGRLSDYVAWIIIGLALIIAVMVMLW
jgi:hypothetical protein